MLTNFNINFEKPKKLTKIQKRDGTIDRFKKNKIVGAIYKSFLATREGNKKIALRFTNDVNELLEATFKEEGMVPTVENVQDVVEQVLMDNGFAKTAKAFILYRAQHSKMRQLRKVIMEVDKTIDGYLGQSDWRVNENSNSDYSISGLMLHSAGSVLAHYTLSTIYPSDIADSHISGDFHIHDLSMGIAGYCAGWSIRQLLEEGFNGVDGKVESGPPKHLETALGQMVNFLGTLQNEWAGAMAFSSFDTYLAPFIRFDNLSYEAVKQSIQQFVFGLNITSRWGGQTPFTNLTFDWVVPDDLKNDNVIFGGKRLDVTYSDFQPEMDIINRAFLQVLEEGDVNGRVFTFPIPTYNITKNFNWDSENANILFKMTAKYGLPYFQNFVNSDLNPSDVRSMCCRLQLDLRELRNKTGGLFGAGESTGSIGVVTINLPRLGYLSKTKPEYFERLEKLMDLAKFSLEIKRSVVDKNLENGLLPYSKRYLKTFDNHFSTIGLVGLNESILNFMQTSIASVEGKAFGIEVLDFMRNKIQDFQTETGNIYNLEATPAEGTSYRLARIDKNQYPDIIQAGTDEPYYTNSSALPVNYTNDVFEALDHQDDLQKKYTGGTVLHIFLGESLSDGDTCKALVKKIASKYSLPYYTITPTFSICKNHGYIRGEHFNCPECGVESEVYSRVVGYFRPVKNWNKGKKEEFKDRKYYQFKLLQSKAS
ncbi:ribonucleoside triphosphate reductase [Candidatus Dependentiae bacterium]|nr:ribonucleoside triphosphate reductase [Candidatus Dependentiae bacterium]